MWPKHTQHQDHQSAANVCLSSKILCIYIVFWIFFRWLLIQSWISCDDILVRKRVWSDLLRVASSESLNMPKTHTRVRWISCSNSTLKLTSGWFRCVKAYSLSPLHAEIKVLDLGCLRAHSNVSSSGYLTHFEQQSAEVSRRISLPVKYDW